MNWLDADVGVAEIESEEKGTRMAVTYSSVSVTLFHCFDTSAH